MDTFLPERRTGARWVAGTGAFLLAVAAALFVAVRWDELSDGARFGLLVAGTGACLAVGRRIRGPLPATGDALFHLGAILLPIDLAALNLRLQLGWRGLLLAEGVLVTVVLGGLGLATGSVVLRRAGIAGGVALAAGIAALGPVPAPLVLAVLAVAALVARQEEAAVAWSATAGLAPLLGAVAAGVPVGAGTLAELGFRGPARLVAVASGLLAALVLGRLATRRADLGLATAAFLVAGIGLADGWFQVDPGVGAERLALAATFLLLQLAALAFRPDPFWGRPVVAVVRAAEVLAGLVTLGLTGSLLFAPLLADVYSSPPSYPNEALALAVLATGWLLAAGRPAVRRLPLLGAATAAALAVELLTMRPLPTGLGLAAAGAGLLVAAGRLSDGRWPLTTGGAAFAFWGTVCATTSDELRVVVGVGVAVVLTTFAARLESRIVAVGAAASLAIGLVAEWQLPRGTAPALAVGGTWALVLLGDALGSRRAGDALRWSMLLVLTELRFLDAGDSVPVLVVATIALAVEAVRTDDTRFAYAAAVLSQVALATVAAAAGLEVGAKGVALCVGAVVPAGVAALVEERRWQAPLLLAAGLGLTLGLQVASAEAASLATAAMVSGGLVLAAALVVRSEGLGHAGAATLTAGFVGHLVLAGVGASEAYLAPVAAQLVAAGVLARRRAPLSSWVAFAPAVAVLGGAAVVERAGGGSGWHALVAGGVGLVALVAGAALRLGGPLVTGTALLVVVTGHESLGVAATVPTWAWLGAGGLLLLAAGVVLERKETSPVEAGRRLVDLVRERYE